MRDHRPPSWNGLFAFFKLGSLVLLIIGLSACKRIPPHPVITEAYIRPDPIVGEIVTLHIEVMSGEDEDDVTIGALLPDEINLVAGELEWHGSLKANQSQAHEMSICVLQPGDNWRIFLGVSETSSMGDGDILHIESTTDSAHVIPSKDYRVVGPGNLVTAFWEVDNVTPTPIPPTVSAECSAVRASSPTPTVQLPNATSTPTVTPTRPFPTITPKPTQRPTSAPVTPDPSLPIPPGEIYFFLDLAPLADSQSLDQQPPSSYNFYKAVPGAAANEWWVETILTDMNLEGPSITMSPDQTKLALLLLDDTDGDGKLIHYRGGDIRNIYIYDRIEHSIERLTNNERSTLSVSWLPDSQGVTYSQSNEIFTTYLIDAVPSLVLQLPDGHVAQLVWSLDGQKLILHAIDQQAGLRVYEPNSESLSSAYETVTGSVLLRWWSPDDHWLAFTHYGAHIYDNWRYVAVMNKESLEVIRLVFGDDFMSSPPDWSLDGQWLAFTKNESILSLWSTESLTVTDVLNGTNMSIPAWSPVDNRLAVTLVEDGVPKVLTLDCPENTVTEIFQSVTYDVFELFDWSPDGEWLLVFAANEEQSGLYIVHVASGISYLVMDTMGSAAPRELVWLVGP